jgi:hypothetical protein
MVLSVLLPITRSALPSLLKSATANPRGSSPVTSMHRHIYLGEPISTTYSEMILFRHRYFDGSTLRYLTSNDSDGKSGTRM